MSPLTVTSATSRSGHKIRHYRSLNRKTRESENIIAQGKGTYLLLQPLSIGLLHRGVICRSSFPDPVDCGALTMTC